MMDDHDRQQLVLGREHYQRGEFDKAEYLLRQVLVRADRFADVHHMLGVIAHNRGQFVQAQEHFEKAVRLNPQYTEAQLNLMVTYNELGKYDAARRVYTQVRARSGETTLDPFIRGRIANMHAEISQAYLDAKLIAEAIRELQKAVALCPQFADLRVRLGLLCRDVGDLAGAHEHLQAARASNPRYVHGRLALATLLLGLGDREGARAEFEAVLEIDPDEKTAKMYLRLVSTALRSLPPDTEREPRRETSDDPSGKE
jgi:tetratricopeptide (TPR) repeat protein